MRKSNANMDRSTFHSWINWPTNNHKKCTKCGCMVHLENRIKIYERDGIRQQEFIPCK